MFLLCSGQEDGFKHKLFRKVRVFKLHTAEKTEDLLLRIKKNMSAVTSVCSTPVQIHRDSNPEHIQVLIF